MNGKEGDAFLITTKESGFHSNGSNFDYFQDGKSWLFREVDLVFENAQMSLGALCEE